MPSAHDRLTAQETYLDNALRRQMRAPIKDIALKKIPGTSGYAVQLTLTRGDEEKTLSLKLPFGAPLFLLCTKSDLTALAKAILTDLKPLIIS
jgi:hypothetical protein